MKIGIQREAAKARRLARKARAKLAEVQSSNEVVVVPAVKPVYRIGFQRSLFTIEDNLGRAWFASADLALTTRRFMNNYL